MEKAQQVHPDLIVLDIKMPRMNGYEACRKLKEIPELCDVPVIFLSAKGQRQEIEEGLDAGAADYILKPFAPEDLIAKVQRLLGLKK
jgi:CheY-like chemotaxis protein